MIARLLDRSRTSGRIDDNIVTYEKRYEGYLKDSLPVVEHLKNSKTRLIEVRRADEFDLT
jgi:adenylate kinase family enzyme